MTDWLPPRASDAVEPPTYDEAAAPARPFEAPSPAGRRVVAGFHGRQRSRDVAPQTAAPPALGEQRPAAQAAAPASSTALPRASESRGGGGGVRFRQRARGGQQNGTARAALSLSIASIVLVVLTLGQACVIAGPMSGTAWYLSVLARRRIATGELQAGGRQATSAQRLAMIGIALSLIAVVVWIVLLSTGYSPEDLERDLREWRDDLQQS